MEKGIEQGIEQGKIQEKLSTASRAYEAGLPLGSIATLVGIDEDRLMVMLKGLEGDKAL